MAHELKINYGTKIDEVLRVDLVTRDEIIFNTYYEGDAKAGAVKIPVRDGETEVADYDKTNISNNKVTYGSTAYITAVIDNDKFVNEYIDGYEAEAVPDNIKAQRVTSAGYSLASVIDTNALKTLVNAVKGLDKAGNAFTDVRAGKTGTKVVATKSLFNDIVSCAVALDNAGVPAEGRYALVTPEAYGELVKSDDFVKASNIGQELVQTGAVGMVNGIPVYKTAKLASIDANITLIVGHYNFATRIEAWQAEPQLFDGSTDASIVGGSLLKGRKVFTHEITKPQAFAYRSAE
jgi:hypothetical protein